MALNDSYDVYMQQVLNQGLKAPGTNERLHGRQDPATWAKQRAELLAKVGRPQVGEDYDKWYARVKHEMWWAGLWDDSLTQVLNREAFEKYRVRDPEEIQRDKNVADRQAMVDELLRNGGLVTLQDIAGDPAMNAYYQSTVGNAARTMHNRGLQGGLSSRAIADAASGALAHLQDARRNLGLQLQKEEIDRGDVAIGLQKMTEYNRQLSDYNSSPLHLGMQVVGGLAGGGIGFATGGVGGIGPGFQQGMQYGQRASEALLGGAPQPPAGVNPNAYRGS